MSEPKFKAQGRKSKAWWLRLIKSFGHQGGINIFARTGNVAWTDVKKIVPYLINAGYVRAEGNKNRPQYKLTSFGNRYLAEHPGELIEPEQERPGSGESYEVPRTPENSKNDRTPVKDSKTNIVRHSVFDESAPPSTPKNKKKGSFRDAFKSVLIEILIERYANQVSAADVMDKLEAKK